MKYCKKCTMPDTRPGITFNEEGVCSACTHYEGRKNVDWDARWKEFEALCDKYRGCNGPGQYDCAIAVSGGKDSVVLLEQLRTLDKRRLQEKICTLSDQEMLKVDVAIMISLGLTEENRINFYKSLMLISENLEKICEK